MRLETNMGVEEVIWMNNIAYIGVYELDGGYAGGLLVCDHRGLPVDFRYVEPIKPTKLQRLIYGAALRRYIMVEAIGAGLLKECAAKYDVAFVDEDLLLELSGQCKAPLAKMSRTDLAPLKAVGECQRVSGNGITYQASMSGAPVQLHFVDADDKAIKGVIEQLSSIGCTLDITEPLERVRKAVAEVSGTDNDGR